jgi:hypothetical protein
MNFRQKSKTKLTALRRYLNVYRIAVVCGLVLAAALALAYAPQMSGASPWAYYYGLQNFSHGKLVVDDQLHNQQVRDARQKGGMLMQYLKIGNNRWAMEKAPGYVFFATPFEKTGIPRGANIVLAAGMVLVTYLLLKRLRDEKTACAGSLLLLLAPETLYTLNRTYMDSIAALSFLVMGGGLYIYYHLERHKHRPVTGGALLFLAFLLAGWSVVTRYTNFLVVAVLALHFIITRLMDYRRGERTKIAAETFAAVLGAGIPLAVILLYDYYVFGSPLEYGYSYTTFPIKFAFQYFGQVDKSGQSLPVQIILENLRTAPWSLLLSFPLLAIGIPGFLAVLIHKVIRLFHRDNLPSRRSGPGGDLSWGLLLVLTGWFVSVFFLYLTYEFTAELRPNFNPYYAIGRFYLPGLFPVAVITSLIVARWPFKLNVPVLLLAVVSGSVLYTHYVLIPAY